MKKPDPNRAAALRRLRRLAGGKINDAVILAVRGHDLTDEEITKLDLSAVAEIKTSKKDGGFDIRLVDPLAVLKLLLDSCGPDNESGSIYEALDRSAENDAV